MKLLGKQDIAKLKASEKKRDIDEGLKLAKRVDSLREVHADEEASLEKFRHETLANITAEITERSHELSTITVEVAKARRARDEALKPLDDERNALAKERNDLIEERKQAEVVKAENDAREHKLNQLIKLARVVMEHVKQRGERSAGLHLDATRDRTEASNLLAEAKSVQESALQFKSNVEAELAQRDMSVASTERRQTMRDEAQDKRERDLNARETALLDREQTLQRNLERHGDKHRTGNGV